MRISCSNTVVVEEVCHMLQRKYTSNEKWEKMNKITRISELIKLLILLQYSNIKFISNMNYLDPFSILKVLVSSKDQIKKKRMLAQNFERFFVTLVDRFFFGINSINQK